MNRIGMTGMILKEGLVGLNRAIKLAYPLGF
jgi:hypothetical protein